MSFCVAVTKLMRIPGKTAVHSVHFRKQAMDGVNHGYIIYFTHLCIVK